MNGHARFWAVDARLYFLAVIVCLTLIFASLDPEGSGQVDGWALIPFWLMHTAIPIALLVGLHILLSHLACFERLNPWLRVTLSGIGGALLFLPIALVLDFMFGNDPYQIFTDQAVLWRAWVDELLGAGPPIVLVWMAINAPQILQLNFNPQNTRPETDQGPSEIDRKQTPQAGFWALVPETLGRELIYLQAELHYIRVVTSQGETLVLYNLRDAIRDLPAEVGMQTHRSYWVAYAQVIGLKRRGAQWICELKNGQSVPVSRRRVASVRATLDGQPAIS